jgi:hypothetical protein
MNFELKNIDNYQFFENNMHMVHLPHLANALFTLCHIYNEQILERKNEWPTKSKRAKKELLDAINKNYMDTIIEQLKFRYEIALCIDNDIADVRSQLITMYKNICAILGGVPDKFISDIRTINVAKHVIVRTILKSKGMQY